MSFYRFGNVGIGVVTVLGAVVGTIGGFVVVAVGAGFGRIGFVVVTAGALVVPGMPMFGIGVVTVLGAVVMGMSAPFF